VEEQMKKLTIVLAAAACAGLAVPASAAGKQLGGQDTAQITAADQNAKFVSDDVSARGKKKKKGVTTKRTSWGG
jgi:hypothetical protein